MLLLRCALLAAITAAAAAAWQENVRPKVFAQLGESTDSCSGHPVNQVQRSVKMLNPKVRLVQEAGKITVVLEAVFILVPVTTRERKLATQRVFMFEK